MKSFRYISIVILSLFVVSCGRDGSLPRDHVRDTAQYDSVFFDVARTACNELHALMVVKDGKVIYENWNPSYGPDHLHVMWSASKTFTATAVGFAVQDGLLEVTDKVVDFFTPEELPSQLSAWLRKMTVYDLLIMSSGFKDDFIGRAGGGRPFDWAKETLASEIVFAPGSRFAYNSMNTYLLSVIVTKVTGKRVDEYLEDKLFRHLGIEEYRWTASPQGYTAGGWGLYMKTEDFAKMGLFMLNKGKWGRKQLLNEEWFEHAMSAQIMQYAGQGYSPQEVARLKDDDWNQGYGYQMWMCRNGGVRLDGAWAQVCVIYPDKDLVVVGQSYASNTWDLLNSIADRIYMKL